MDIAFDAQNVLTSSLSNAEIKIEASEVDETTLFDNFSAADVMKHMDVDGILDEIGGDAVVAWATANGHIEEE